MPSSTIYSADARPHMYFSQGIWIVQEFNGTMNLQTRPSRTLALITSRQASDHHFTIWTHPTSDRYNKTWIQILPWPHLFQPPRPYPECTCNSWVEWSSRCEIQNCNQLQKIGSPKEKNLWPSESGHRHHASKNGNFRLQICQRLGQV